VFYQLHHTLDEGDICSTPHTSDTAHYTTSFYLVEENQVLPT
jgi:hypothetical protein